MKSVRSLLLPIVALSLVIAPPLLAKKQELPEVTEDGLHRVPDSKMAIVYAEPGADLAQYQRIQLLSAYVAFKKNWARDQRSRSGQSFRATDRDIEKIKTDLANEFDEVFRKVLEDGGYQVVDTEGGHADYAPIDDVQSAVVNCLRERYGRVSLERLLSGKGILNIYLALCSIEGVEAQFESPAEVVAAALEHQDDRALQTLHMFCEGMGSAAGNLALTFGAKGGIYIAGGVIPRFQEFFINSGFRSKFEDKGRFVSYLQPIPVYLVIRSNLGLLGAAKKLQQI